MNDEFLDLMTAFSGTFQWIKTGRKPKELRPATLALLLHLYQVKAVATGRAPAHS